MLPPNCIDPTSWGYTAFGYGLGGHAKQYQAPPGREDAPEATEHRGANYPYLK